MEAYYHSDPRIEEWVNEITEKIFTVCLLKGPDAELEFQRGCQIVSNVTNLLQGISMFPTEYLEEGLKQLLEQQLPDSRIISNFPTFQDTMNRMLREGMLSAMDTQSKEKIKTRVPSESNTKEKTNEDAKVDAKVSTLVDNELVMAALASVSSMTTKLLVAEVELLPAPELDELMVTTSDKQTKPYGIIRKTQVPEQADRLKHVLSNIFPNASIAWNLNLMGQTFLAQVEDMLICLYSPEQPCPVKNFNKEGWKVYTCTSNDLMFPRRLERGIRQIQRFGKGRNG